VTAKEKSTPPKIRSSSLTFGVYSWFSFQVLIISLLAK